MYSGDFENCGIFAGVGGVRDFRDRETAGKLGIDFFKLLFSNRDKQEDRFQI